VRHSSEVEKAMTPEKRTPERPDLVLYTVEETAEILRVSIPTVYRYIREKGLRATRFSPRKTFIAREDLLEFVESHKTRDVGRIKGSDRSAP